MEKIKAKTPVSDVARQQIIDTFMNDIKNHRDHLNRYDSYKKVILFIASTSDTVNKNGRIIDGDFVEKNLENFIGVPIKFDHNDSQKSILGNVFYTSVCVDEANKCKYTVLASVVDNLSEMTKTQLNEYSKLNFSVGYQSFGSDVKCDKCNRETELFFNIYTKNLECEHCDNVLKGHKYNHDKLNVKSHARVFKRDNNKKYIGYSWDSTDLSLSHLPDVKKKSKKDSDLYFMVIQDHKVSEVSFVDTPADALEAPLIAFTDVGTLLALENKNDSAFLTPHLNKMDYITDNSLNDNININLYTNNGESYKMNDYIFTLVTRLYSKDDAPKDLVLKDFFKDEQSKDNLKDELTDALAIKYIDAYVAQVLDSEKALSEQVKTLSDEMEVLKKELADKEAKISELTPKGDNGDSGEGKDPQLKPEDKNPNPSGDNSSVVINKQHSDNNVNTSKPRRVTT